MRILLGERLRRKSGTILRLFVLSAILALTLGSGMAPAGALTDRFTLGLGSEAFWDGKYIEYGLVYDPAQCGSMGPCWDYQLDLTEPGARLRVALAVTFKDQSYVRWWADYLNYDAGVFSQDTAFTMQLFDPQGNLAASNTTDWGYAREVFVENPAVGLWTVRVIPTRVQHMGFRMRAKLEPEAVAPGVESVLAPNLRIIPPFEANFNTPTFTYGPSTPNPGSAPSCMTEEYVEAEEEGDPRPAACLRVSAGIENLGPGPLLLMPSCNDFPWLSHPDCKPATQELPEDIVQMYQRRVIEKADGSIECCVDEPVGSAGVAEYHDFHGHFHYEDVYVYELYKIRTPHWVPQSARTPALEYVATSQKRGFWPWDERMADWERFFHQPMNNYETTAPLWVGVGWGDVYEYNRGGQFISFPVTAAGFPEPGYYLIRGVADVDGKIIEADESDNVSYALIEVGGRKGPAHIELIERGYGESPWDANKQALTYTP